MMMLMLMMMLLQEVVIPVNLPCMLCRQVSMQNRVEFKIEIKSNKDFISKLCPINYNTRYGKASGRY